MSYYKGVQYDFICNVCKYIAATYYVGIMYINTDIVYKYKERTVAFLAHWQNWTTKLASKYKLSTDKKVHLGLFFFLSLEVIEKKIFLRLDLQE